MTNFIRVVDLETTGFTPPDHAPCEVAWVDLQSDGPDLSGAAARWSVPFGSGNAILCNPSRPIPPETSAIHHIIDEDVQASMFWPEAIRRCAAPLGMFRPIAFAAHNAKFERQWITDEITGGEDRTPVPWLCTYKCALRVWPEAPGHSNQALRYWLKPEGLSRDIADRAHRAYPDAYVTAFLLRELLARASFDDLVKWSGEPALLAKVPFGQSRGARWSEVDYGFLQWILALDFDEDVMHTARTERDRRDAEWQAERAKAIPQ